MEARLALENTNLFLTGCSIPKCTLLADLVFLWASLKNIWRNHRLNKPWQIPCFIWKPLFSHHHIIWFKKQPLRKKFACFIYEIYEWFRRINRQTHQPFRPYDDDFNTEKGNCNRFSCQRNLKSQARLQNSRRTCPWNSAASSSQVKHARNMLIKANY